MSSITTVNLYYEIDAKNSERVGVIISGEQIRREQGVHQGSIAVADDVAECQK